MDQLIAISKKTNIEYKHRPGESCASVAWSGLLNYHGHKFNTADIFGLGSGLIFNYKAVPQTKLFNMPLMSSTLVPDFLTNIGMYGSTITFKNDQFALEQILNCLDKGLPVAVQLNPNFCQNLVETTPKEILGHIAPHWVVVVGYDLEKKVLILFDNAKFSQIEISIDDFIKGRSTGHFTQNPQNFFYSINLTTELYPLEISVTLSLRKTIFYFLHTKKFLNVSMFIGKYGFEKAIRHIGLWNKMLNPAQLAQTISMLQMTVTGAGSVKGGYRKLFATYLKRAAVILKKDELNAIAEDFSAAAKEWITFVQLLETVQKDPTNTQLWGKESILTKVLKDIYHKELSGFNKLEAIMNDLEKVPSKSILLS